MDLIFKKSLVVASTTIMIDFLFHYFLTHPMESLTYFVIKFLLAFFVASAILGSNIYKNKIDRRWLIIFITGLFFSALMSIYYRSWELGEAGVPFGSRAPNIIGIARTNLILFSGTWWLGHTLFFIIGVWLSNLISNKK
ncbi:MAG: hypothetical protein UT86_C0005G0008 [Candidatus Magasanikbacteria bacterium GW2011_GWC2_40_17]|uniref:Uncharacterized protein n=1 Tax=Candidatus Magasanikbacteria bacterium GW2011_GWA2_42_32 TaxID=1619039 RepID=A0A0G1A714_9BACT|nr:MAG: hypothetical protein UT86_C0005G0008 [Candidatus Magasanikbacteria bacterium GW2011_GWC2_40_17]KKS56744.1 MAG: hypothetical protein UV20_C0006G0027 [Candidatus Magasanikbacteria bacterium GW2011_GWA2_42_32]OGH86068.1 MAG: hypothetical protein A2294_02285 [Candidatus Magasanikbacteria bacterium RIFOXYB2_FULL_38_10]